MFEGTSKYAASVDGAMLYIIGFSVLMLLLITAAMIYFVIRYNAKRHPKPIQTHGNAVVEVVWIVIPTIIVISMFFYGYTDYKDLRNTEEFDENVQVTAKMWEWDFEYENGVKSDTLYVPVDKVIKFDITSLDVLHSFYIPAYRLKEDAVPGRNGYMFITPEKLGDFDIACAEYCGLNHWNMYTKFVVLPQDEYYNWLENEAKKLESEDTANSTQDSKESKLAEK